METLPIYSSKGYKLSEQELNSSKVIYMWHNENINIAKLPITVLHVQTIC